MQMDTGIIPPLDGELTLNDPGGAVGQGRGFLQLTVFSSSATATTPLRSRSLESA